MKRLYLLRSTRHRSTISSSLPDYHHPLTQRGEIAAIAMGKRMQENSYMPEHVVCATATRTRQTLANIWPYLTDAQGKAPELALDYQIHLARGEAVLHRLQETAKRISSLLLVSIAPGISDLARLLIKPVKDQPGPFSADLPMGALAVFDCGIESWAELSPGCGSLIKILH